MSYATVTAQDQLKRLALLSLAAWVITLTLSFFWNERHLHNSIHELAINEARISIKKDITYRQWVAVHGGVYVPVTAKTQPNPYLAAIPDRDITTLSGKRLTLVNSAYMTRQIIEMERDKLGPKVRLTSLRPLSPENTPLPWERVALEALSSGKEEYITIDVHEGKPYLNYVRPFFTEEACLKCHAHQGYRLGDIRGGMSVSIPLAPYRAQEQNQRQVLLAGHLLMFALGTAGIGVGHRLIGRTLKDQEVTQKMLHEAQVQLFQQEKMASIGQLAAGVAHEINNPIGFIMSNLGTLGKYLERLRGFIAAQDEIISEQEREEASQRLAQTKKNLKIEYIMGDIDNLITESVDGAERVKKIVQDLKSFSRIDGTEVKVVNLHDCLDSTINIVWNELKYKATLKKEYGDVPPLKCNPQQLNQVFMNLLVNAGHAIESQGEITVQTWREGKNAFIAISDTGCGIHDEVKTRIFEPFFTTKEVGKGTGLGLSISYDIVKNHGGEITVESKQGKGTTFTVQIPVRERS